MYVCVCPETQNTGNSVLFNDVARIELQLLFQLCHECLM